MPGLQIPCTHPPHPLRIGILLDARIQPAWVGKILSKIQRVSYAELCLVTQFPEAPGQVTPPERTAGRPSMWKLFAALDRKLHQKKVKFTQAEDLSPILEQVPVRLLAGHSHGDLSAEDLKTARGANLDLVLDFCAGQTDVRLPARYGTLPFFKDLYEWQIPKTVFSFLLDLYEHGGSAIRRNAYTRVSPPDRPEAYSRMNAFSLLRMLGSVLFQKAYRNLFDLVNAERWEIAYDLSEQDPLSGGSFSAAFRLTPPIYQIYGDPFPVVDDNRIYLFFERMPALGAHRRGELVVTEIDPLTGRAGSIRPVLSTGYHLSYPFIFEWNGEKYMIPETGANCTIDLYRSTHFPDRWEFCQTLVKDFPAVDTTLVEKNGAWWMFTSRHHAVENDERIDTLEIFSASSPLGPWQPHARNPIKIASHGARSAGWVFEQQGSLIRPTQDCSPRYGYGLVFNRIDVLSEAEFHETEIGRLEPGQNCNFLGVHTFNRAEGFSVIDINRYRNWFYSWHI